MAISYNKLWKLLIDRKMSKETTSREIVEKMLGRTFEEQFHREKAKIGDQWAKLAGKQYKYYMVFETKQPDYPGAYSLERFMEIVNGL